MLAVYLAVLASPVAALLQASSEAERWQSLQRVALSTYLALLFCLAWSLYFEERFAAVQQSERRARVPLSVAARWSFVGLLVVLFVSFLPASSLTATLGWLLLWISVGGMTVWALQTGYDLGGAKVRQRLAIVLLVSVLIALAVVTIPLTWSDLNTYLTSLRMVAGVVLFTLLLNALRLGLAEEMVKVRGTDTGAKMKFPQAWEQRLLVLLFLLALIGYGYAKFTKATVSGVVIVSVCLVVLNVGLIAWLVRRWYKGVP